MRAGELFRAVKKDAEDIRLMTRLCEDPASVGKLLEPALKALVCRCALRKWDVDLAAPSCAYYYIRGAVDSAHNNLNAACALYRKWVVRGRTETRLLQEARS